MDAPQLLYFILTNHGGPSVCPSSSNSLPQVQCITTALLSLPIPIRSDSFRSSVRCVLIVVLVPKCNSTSKPYSIEYM
jgi:hypothetical protein